MKKTTTELIKIVNAGGGIIINASSKTTSELIKIVSASKEKNVSVILTHVRNTTTEIEKIANAGNGNVIFDLQ